jgi:hypothetical protein
MGNGAADRGQYRQAAGAIAQSLNYIGAAAQYRHHQKKKETKDEKQAQHFGQCQM